MSRRSQSRTGRLRDPLRLARQLGRAGGAVARDAVGDLAARSLPLAPEALTDPDVFAALFASDSCQGRIWRPERIRRTPHSAPSSNCRNSVLALDWGTGASGPKTVFVKQPSADLSTRLFANVIGFWKTECAVCRNLSDTLPIETPEIYAVVERGSRFVLVMENLDERKGVRLFVNRELLDGPDPETARRCLDTLARLHAGFERWSPARREQALPIALDPLRSPSLHPVVMAVNRQAAGPCHRRAPEVFDRDAVALYHRALSSWEILERAWYREPLTLVHGDSHLGNFFASASAMGMLDFQGAHWGRGVRDVQYFLVNSLPVDALAARERELVAHYAAARTRLGAPLDPEQAWDQYRGSSFQTLMTAVVSLGLGSFTDSEDVMRAMLERAVAAVRRLDFAGWLDERCQLNPAERESPLPTRSGSPG